VQLTGTSAARPDGVTTDIRSYARRGTRLNARQQDAWTAYADRWVIPEDLQARPGFRLREVFDRPAGLVVEIGCGVGEHLAAAAADRPADNVIGFEVWRPGVAECLAAIASSGVSNVRLSTLDAAWCFENLIEPATLTEVWTFFPDPWPKARHHKRRLVNARFASLAASRLAPGGVWRLATDWPHYADQIREVLDAEAMLSGGVTERYADRPPTRFERRGIAAGRPVTDLTYTRTR
jgi:tRNA (guanine-N7-)-methyltransferase